MKGEARNNRITLEQRLPGAILSGLNCSLLGMRKSGRRQQSKRFGLVHVHSLLQDPKTATLHTTVLRVQNFYSVIEKKRPECTYQYIYPVFPRSSAGRAGLGNAFCSRPVHGGTRGEPKQWTHPVFSIDSRRRRRTAQQAIGVEPHQVWSKGPIN